MDSEPGRHQDRIVDAGNEVERHRTGCARALSGNAAVEKESGRLAMSSDVIAIQTAEAAGRPWIQTLHEWVTTVDHKRLGVLYILYALFFLVIGAIEAPFIRIQLMPPPHTFFSPHLFTPTFPLPLPPHLF